MLRIGKLTSRKRAVLALAGCLAFGVAHAAPKSRTDEGIEVPPNTVFKLELLSSISTASNKKGDEFNCLVVAPREFSGATVEGRITKLKNSGRVGKKSE